jgi:ADP-heptose:LPS heptosyltransferase
LYVWNKRNSVQRPILWRIDFVGNSSLQFDPASIQRVLIYRLGSLGDTVAALPALHLVERAFPFARRWMLTNIPVHTKAPAAAAVLEGSGLVHGYVSYPVATRSVRQLAEVWWRIRRFRPQVLIYLMPSRREGSLQRDVKFFRLCGVRHIVGLPYADLNEYQFDPEKKLWEQEAHRLARCVRPLGEADIDDLRWWDLRLTDAEMTAAQSALKGIGSRPIIALGPGTKMQANDWGRENWRGLIDKLSGEFPDHALILVGAPEDAAVGEYAGGGWRGPVLNLCGQLKPRQTAAVLRRAELFLGPDSGPKHLASSQGVPCALVFSARGRPGIWYPPGQGHRVVYHQVECAGCGLETCIEQKKKCLTSIPVDEMFVAALDAWKNGKMRRATELRG